MSRPSSTRHDLWTIPGQYDYKPPLPATDGTEAVGIVDALGEDVQGIAPGQRVAVAPVQGAWVEYFIAPAQGLVPVPDGVADEVAAQLIAMPFSAISLLEFLRVERGDWMIQNAANGAVGKTLATFAEARSVHVVNLVRRDAGTVLYPPPGKDGRNGAHDRCRRPIRAAVDSIGGRASDDLMELLGENGVLVSFGSMTGEPIQISPVNLIFKHTTVKGLRASKVSAAMPESTRRRLFAELLELAAKGELKLPVDKIYDLADMAASLRSGRKDKVLLRP